MEDFEPIKLLGAGSFGKVYLMKHSKTNDLVCTKVIKLKNIPPREQEACRNEVELLRRMCHPNIVGYSTSLIYKQCLCIIMEYCDAGDLGDRVKQAKGNLFPESKVMTWFVQIALGLHYMHTNRVLHRDIKTQNVFILSSGRVVLGDFGISKLLEGSLQFASTCIGTPYYMSPEILKKQPYNHKSDVWALGCLLYELLTLNHAFDAQSLNCLVGKIVKGKFPPVSTNEYSKNLRGMLNDMLAINPKRRPDTEQILRKAFVSTRVREFVSDLNAEGLHRQDTAMENLNEQLLDLKMGDAISKQNMMVDPGMDGDGGPNAPSPSEPSAATSTAKRGLRSRLKAEKHQLERQEEKRIAAEMALNRLRKKVDERRRLTILSRSNSPTAGSSEGGEGAKERSSIDTSRPSLFKRLGGLTASQLNGRKCLSTPSSPSNPAESTRTTPQTSRNRCRSGSIGFGTGISDLNTPVGMAVTAATAGQDVMESVSDPPPSSQHSKSGTNALDRTPSAKCSRGEVTADGAESGGSVGKAKATPQSLSIRLDESPLPVRSGRRSARSSEDGVRGASHDTKSRPLFVLESDPDLFHVLKAKAPDSAGEDHVVHAREEELIAKLREAEQRCRDLEKSIERVREAGRHRGAIATEASPAILPVIKIRMNSVPMGENNAAFNEAGPSGYNSGNSRASSVADDDQASDFDEEPVPYCDSHMEEFQDAPTPVGNLAKRAEFLKNKCIEGLGRRKFETAFEILKRMQEGDYMVNIDGVNFNGNNEEDVGKVIIKVLGKDKVRFWSLMEQLLLMT